MDLKELQELKLLATSVREVVQTRIQQEAEQTKRDYTDFGCPKDLEGACGYASWGLWLVLPGSALVLGEWDGMTHCWIEYNGLIVDITATQFGSYRKVRVLRKTGKAAKAYAEDTRNGVAEANIIDWYPVDWQEELCERLVSHGLVIRRAA